jgi:phosphopantetheine adenylyltransferase
MSKDIINSTESERDKTERGKLISKLIEFKTYKIMSRSETLLTSLKDYLIPERLNKILPILTGESKISIRVIEWFVTNYCKKKNIAFIRKDKYNKEIYFNVYLNYKGQLKSYNKDLFDPFCRGEELIDFPIGNDKYIVTNIPQLNFFKWALEFDIINYIEENLDDIYKDMTENNSKAKKKSDNKRQELSECATKKLNQLNCKIKLSI